jgi:hypothetical protein
MEAGRRTTDNSNLENENHTKLKLKTNILPIQQQTLEQTNRSDTTNLNS